MLYQWFKEDQQLKEETNSELHLTKVNPTNEGLYICRVANARGYQFSRWIRVVVEKTKPESVVKLEKKHEAQPERPPDVDETDASEDGITRSGNICCLKQPMLKLSWTRRACI